MGRVSDAMRRAGQHEGEAAAAGSDAAGLGDMPFVSGEAGELVSAKLEETDRETPLLDSPAFKNVEPLAPRRRLVSVERAPRDSGSDTDVRIVDVLGVLFRHRWLMAAVVGVCVAAATAYNYTAVPVFEARAKLIIEPSSAEVVPFRGPSMEDQSRTDYFVTQIEVLRSRALVGGTLIQLGILNGESNAAVEQVSAIVAGLTIAPVKSEMGETRVVNVSYKSVNPELAARIVNSLTQNYVNQNLESRRQGSLVASEALNQRLADLRNDVKSSQGQLQQYRQQKEGVSLGDQQNIVVQKLAHLNSAATSARMDRLDKQTLYEQLKGIRESGAPLDTFSPILSSGFVQGLKAELAGLQRQKAQLSESLGDAHPEMIKVNTAIAAAERRLDQEMAKIVDGIENDYLAAQTREQGMVEALESQKREVLALSEKSIGFNALQRDATSTQQMFDTVLQRVKETELAGGLQTNNARVLDVAQVPREPITPRKRLNLILALLGGAFVAIGLAFTREFLNPRLAGRDDVAATLGVPVLGTAPKIDRLKALSAADALPPAFQEALRAIRTRILLSPIAGAARALAVTSTNAGEGKTRIASSLAASMATAGRRVLLIDADLRRPQLHQMFKIPISPGLSDLLRRDANPSDAVIASPFRGLYLLPAGADVVSTRDTLNSQRLIELIEKLSHDFDAIVLDCPPVMPVADATIVANAAGSVLFVVASGTTSRSDALVALDRLASVQVQVVGAVINKAKPDSASAYHYERSFTEHTA